jgi:hypothetical protein
VGSTARVRHSSLSLPSLYSNDYIYLLYVCTATCKKIAYNRTLLPALAAVLLLVTTLVLCSRREDARINDLLRKAISI